MTHTPRARLGLVLTLVIAAGPAAAFAQKSGATGHESPHAAPPRAAASPHAGPSAAAEPAASEVERYRQHILTLANPYFEGRRPGTRGNERAAEYIEFWFKELGLRPAFSETAADAEGGEAANPGAGYRQTFPYGRDLVVTQQSVTLLHGETPKLLMPQRDFETLGVSGSGTVRGDVVFVGYGIKAGPDGFTNFPPGTDGSLAGKIAMVLRFEPINEDGRSAFTGGAWSNEAGLPGKFRTLANMGVSGIILVSPPGADDPRIHKLETAATTARITRPFDIPIVMLSMEAADRLVSAVPMGQEGDGGTWTLEKLRRKADKGPDGFVTLPGAAVEISTTIDRPSRDTDNVAAILPGKGDLAGEYVVVGAHFDHVGDGSLGGSRARDVEAGLIHYGADDNASGTAGMLLAAERLKREYDALPKGAQARSILFIGFSAEEIGLVGSRHFVKHSDFDAKSIYAMINMDMIGRLREDKLEVSGTGTAEGFEDVLGPLFDASGLQVGKVEGGRGPSDHASFYAAGIPVLHFFTGYHDEYHTPRDTADLINCEGGAKVAGLASDVALTLATRSEPLVFRSTDRRSKDPHGGEQAQTGLGGVKVRFGIAPGSYSDTEPGVAVGDVFPGTSASDAGIKAGDRLLKWNGEVIEDVQGWMAFLRKANPGDEVEVIVRRDGAEIPIKVKLKGRDVGAR